MNKDGKIKGKFNIIDIGVIILLLAVIVGLGVRFGSKITTAVKSDETFEYVVKISSVRQYTVDALKETMETGSALTDKKATVELGKITNIEAEPASMLSERTDGTIVDAPQEDRLTVYITIRAQGKEAENSYILPDSNELSVGGGMEVFSKYIHTSGTITSIKKIEE